MIYLRLTIPFLLSPVFMENEKNADLSYSKKLGKNKIWFIAALKKLEETEKMKVKNRSILGRLYRLEDRILIYPAPTHPKTSERIRYVSLSS